MIAFKAILREVSSGGRYADRSFAPVIEQLAVRENLLLLTADLDFSA
jgi:hypothetical protein